MVDKPVEGLVDPLGGGLAGTVARRRCRAHTCASNSRIHTLWIEWHQPCECESIGCATRSAVHALHLNVMPGELAGNHASEDIGARAHAKSALACIGEQGRVKLHVKSVGAKVGGGILVDEVDFVEETREDRLVLAEHRDIQWIEYGGAVGREGMQYGVVLHEHVRELGCQLMGAGHIAENEQLAVREPLTGRDQDYPLEHYRVRLLVGRPFACGNHHTCLEVLESVNAGDFCGGEASWKPLTREIEPWGKERAITATGRKQREVAFAIAKACVARDTDLGEKFLAVVDVGASVGTRDLHQKRSETTVGAKKKGNGRKHPPTAVTVICNGLRPCLLTREAIGDSSHAMMRPGSSRSSSWVSRMAPNCSKNGASLAGSRADNRASCVGRPVE